MKLNTKLLAISLALFGSFIAAVPASAQVLVVDLSRVDQETAAAKDFRLQTQEIRTATNQLNAFLQRGGALEKSAYELEKKKAVIGPQKYEEEINKLVEQRANAQRNLQSLQAVFNQLYEEFAAQYERARTPIFRDILNERKAKIILPKRVILASGAGLDITTEVIERLDAALSTVELNVPDLGGKKQDGEAATGATKPADKK